VFEQHVRIRQPVVVAVALRRAGTGRPADPDGQHLRRVQAIWQGQPDLGRRVDDEVLVEFDDPAHADRRVGALGARGPKPGIHEAGRFDSQRDPVTAFRRACGQGEQHIGDKARLIGRRGGVVGIDSGDDLFELPGGHDLLPAGRLETAGQRHRGQQGASPGHGSGLAFAKSAAHRQVRPSRSVRAYASGCRAGVKMSATAVIW